MLQTHVDRKPKKRTLPISKAKPHDHTPQLKRLSRIKGQVEGVERMINDRRYCPEIVMQIKAVRAALKSLETSIIEGHIGHCVRDAIQSGDAFVAQQKVDEVLALIKAQS